MQYRFKQEMLINYIQYVPFYEREKKLFKIFLLYKVSVSVHMLLIKAGMLKNKFI